MYFSQSKCFREISLPIPSFLCKIFKFYNGQKTKLCYELFFEYNNEALFFNILIITINRFLAPKNVATVPDAL